MSKALGRGLSALIPETKNMEEGDKIVSMDINQIKYNHLQPRLHYDKDSLEDLKQSIKDKGLLQPILVRAVAEGFEVVAGERRLRAAQELKMTRIPVLVKDLTDKEALVIALVENIQREQLNPIEEAEAFQKLITEFSHTPESLALAVGKDRSTIANFIRLLKLPGLVKQALASGQISVGHARALLGLEKESDQLDILEKMINFGMSVRDVERTIKQYQAGKPEKKTVHK
ncbi:MAG: ParB/RepB/Spo0J family partition protein, partial [Candidatus Moranbacteria bacterium]|nr:ParB/RepB/Spo0J family partition protein [Candidatus Moranbacteria bacterium]